MTDSHRYVDFPELDDCVDDLRQLSVYDVTVIEIDASQWMPLVIFLMPGLAQRSPTVWTLARRPTIEAARGSLVHLLRGLAELRQATRAAWPWAENQPEIERAEVDAALDEALRRSVERNTTPAERHAAAMQEWCFSVRPARRAAGIRQDLLAERLEVRVADLSALENGRPTKLRPSVLRLIAAELKIPSPPELEDPTEPAPQQQKPGETSE